MVKEEAKDPCEGLEKELSELRAVSQGYKETLQRLQAEFENFSKRTEREKHEFRKIVNASLLEDFLPLVDTIEEAEKHAKQEEAKKGFGKIKGQLLRILEKNGVKKIESVGKKFDHSLHECMLTVSEEGKADGEVLEEFARGYALYDKILRPAKVKVNKKNQD
ncbi:MAG: nucleotide exchange factor GrpE [archaeon]|nr:nucleotide exchange factor GrpE [archaeon]